MDYITSDTHFSHYNIIEYCERPFKDTTEMNDALISNWNSVVSKNDRVWHLGDFCMCGKKSATEIVKQLRGYKILILGNHDNHSEQWFLDIGFDKVYKHPVVLHKKYIFSHFPMQDVENLGIFVNVHGHIHQKSIDDEQFYNVSVEHHGYKPVSINSIREIYEGK
jgi:calcineurin-like phosphoesterase family protein